MSIKQCPIGISILSILSVLGGVALILIGIFTSIFFLTMIEDVSLVLTMIEEWIGPNAIIQLIPMIGPVLSVAGIFFVAVGYGLSKGKGWARTSAIVYYIIILTSGFLFLPTGLITVVIAGLIIYYLFRPEVKVFFGKAEAIKKKLTIPRPQEEEAPAAEEETKYCWSCGTEMPAEAQYCPECGEKQ